MMTGFPMSKYSSGGSSEPRNALTPCPRCRALQTTLGTETDRFVYLRCGACYEVWALPERRHFRRETVKRAAPASVQPQTPRVDRAARN